MRYSAPSPFIALIVMASQLLGPTALWAAEQRGIRFDTNRQIIVSALSGDQLTLQRESGASPLQFREVLAEGARVSTGSRTTAELLISNRILVTLGNETTAQVRTMSADQTMILITKGTVRVAAAASVISSQELVTVQTPTNQVQTRGGIVRVQVDAPVNKAERNQNSAQAYRVSYSPEPIVAAVTSPSDLILVEEGTADISGVGPTGGSLTVKAGQQATVQAGRAGALGEAVSPGAQATSILATTSHTLTPKEGRDYLVTLQVDQATKLSQALTGAAETDPKESGKRIDTKDVINGATGGVALQNNLVSALFGEGNSANPSASRSLETTGNGYGGVNSNQAFGNSPIPTSVFLNNNNTLLTYTRKDPIDQISSDTGEDSRSFKPLDSIASRFVVSKELVLIGGTPNEGHGGIAPTEKLIIRGLSLGGLQDKPTNTNFVATDRDPARLGGQGIPDQIVTANNTFVVDHSQTTVRDVIETEFDPQEGRSVEIAKRIGGTLGQYSADPDRRGVANRKLGGPFYDTSLVIGAITATGANIELRDSTGKLTGGVSLDQGTQATIGRTEATSTYFSSIRSINTEAKFDGSLLAVIGGKSQKTSLTVGDRLLGVYDGSRVDIDTDPTNANKPLSVALLSVLDAKLRGPSVSGPQAQSIPLIDIAAGTHATRQYVTKNGNIVLTPDGNLTFSDDKKTRCENPECVPNVMVTSALVTRSTSKLNLDGALLEASAPLFALTQANMTTRSHFADLAGNQAQSLNLNGAIVALDAAKLVIESGHLLNLNSATAAISGYLFSLTNGSALQINNGSLFSLTNNSSLMLTGNAFGVFGNGTNALSIQNHLCGAGGACGFLVDSAGHQVTLDGTALRVAGVTQNVALPNGFNVFALTQQANKPTITIGADAALFKVDPTSHLSINGTKVR